MSVGKGGEATIKDWAIKYCIYDLQHYSGIDRRLTQYIRGGIKLFSRSQRFSMQTQIAALFQGICVADRLGFCAQRRGGEWGSPKKEKKWVIDPRLSMSLQI